jgi:hypothetical protein
VKHDPEGMLVSVDIFCENQKGEKTSVGAATAIVPSH